MAKLWIEKQSGIKRSVLGIRVRLLLFFSTTLLLLFAIYLYANHMHRQNFIQTNTLLDELHTTLQASTAVQLDLKAERTAWKNVLLRGTEPGKYHEYLNSFFDEERKVRRGIRKLQAIFRNHHEIHALLLELDQSHLDLGRSLRQAIASFNTTSDSPHLVADAIAARLETDPDTLIVEIASRIEQRHEQLTKSLIATMEEKELLLGVSFLGSILLAALLFIWLIDRQVGRPAQQAAFLANYDTLTGLPNRTLFQDRLQHAMDQADRNKSQLALLFFDLDHFKTINDVLGHRAGDELLRQAGNRLRHTLRKSDTPARLGGDEFAVILEGVDADSQAAGVAEHIRHALGRPFDLMGKEGHVSTSIGITLYPGDGDNIETLLMNADAAMYLAKEKGRNTYHFFTADLNQAAARRMSLENRLRNAVRNGEFNLHYQPQVRMDDGQVIGAEALLRLENGDGPIPPGEFIPVLEESGLILDVGPGVLKQACLAAKEMRECCIGEFNIAVNLSARQLRDSSLLKHVKDALDESGLPAHCLELEITEYNLIDSFRSNDILGGIKALGVQIAIDDFGTGYSSLSYLKSLSVDTLKIDRSFIHDINRDRGDDAVTSAIIALARTLGIAVIAEGVETDEQLAFLKNQGCEYIQGNLVSPPMPADAFGQWLEQHQRNSRQARGMPA